MSHSVYFVGAGLSKALQDAKPVPLLADFVATASHYAKEDRIILTTLISLELANRFRWPSDACSSLAKLIDKDEPDALDVEGFLEAMRRRPGESIEDLLGRHTGSVEDAPGHSPAVRFRYAISRMFYLIGWNVNLGLLRLWVQKRLSVAPGRHSFVSFNYDLFLDRTILHAIPDWHWHCGYGFTISDSTAQDPENPYPDCAPAGSHRCQSDVRVLKPHGSLNWLVPVVRPAEAMPFGDGPVAVRVDEVNRPEYIGTTTDFPRLRYRDGKWREVAPGIIAPLHRKDAALQILSQIRDAEVTAISEAREVFVLGWSMPPTDHYQCCLIRYAAGHRSRPIERLVVVNRDQPPEYFERVADTFGVPFNAVETWNAGIADYIHAAGAG